MPLALVIVVTCLAMVLKDAVATFQTKAEAEGNERLSGVLDPIGTLAGVFFYAYGAVRLLHFGLGGYLGIIPILIIDYIDGRYFTAVSRCIKSDATEAQTGFRTIWSAMKTVAMKYITELVVWLVKKLPWIGKLKTWIVSHL